MADRYILEFKKEVMCSARDTKCSLLLRVILGVSPSQK